MARFVGADRGLKRLSLTRVDDLELAAAVTARVGDDAGDARRRTLADPFQYLLLLDADDRPLGWVDERRIPADGRLDAALVETTSPLLDRRTTLKDALSMLLDGDVQAGVVVDRRGTYRGIVNVEQIAAYMRDTAREAPAATARPATTDDGPRGRRPGRGRLVIDWAWMGDHLDDLAARLVQHLYLALIAVVIGFVISFALSVWSVRRRRVYAPITAFGGILYTIPSLAMFAALIPITGISLITAEIPLVLYTILIFVRNTVAGFDAVPRDVLEAADGMGYVSSQRLWRVELPLATPLMIAGLRVACVSTIGLVAITATIGDRFGGLGFFIFEGWRHFFPTEMLFGAVPSMLLAVAVDLSLVAVQRRTTPWTHAAEVQPLRALGEAA